MNDNTYLSVDIRETIFPELVEHSLSFQFVDQFFFQLRIFQIQLAGVSFSNQIHSEITKILYDNLPRDFTTCHSKIFGSLGCFSEFYQEFVARFVSLVHGTAWCGLLAYSGANLWRTLELRQTETENSGRNDEGTGMDEYET